MSNLNMTAADDLLLRIISHDWNPSQPIPDVLVDDPDWATIVRSALHHGVAGLFCRVLRSSSAWVNCPEIVDAAGAYYARAECEGSALVTQLTVILDVLESDGIPALAFKGPALGMLAHASPTIRPSRDLDILVHPKDMERTIEGLGRLGYVSPERFSPKVMNAYCVSNGQSILFAEGRSPVEPHCAFAPQALSVLLQMDGIWERARQIAIAGRAVPSLSLEDTLFTACLHGCKDKWWRLLWVADVAALIYRHPELDWPAMMDRAEQAGGRRMFLLGLALSRDLFASTLPPNVVAAIERDPTCMWLVQQSKIHLFGPVVDLGTQNHVSRYHLRSRERIGDRIRYVWRTITTPRVIHFRMVRLPDSLFFGYFAVKLVHDYLLLPIWLLWRRIRAPSPDPAA